MRIQPELFRQQEGLRHYDHRDTENHVVANLGRLTIAGRAGMDDGLAHFLQHWPRAFEGLIAAAYHEGQACRFGPGHAARNWGVDHCEAFILGGLRHLARGLHVDSRGID